MLSVEIDGGVELRDAMARFTPDLASNMEKQIQTALRPIVRKARGFVPSQAPLSTWGFYSQQRKGKFPWFNTLEIRAGIYATTETPARNKRGFSYAASIVNSSAVGSIIETAGRRNPNGRPQGKYETVTIKSSNPAIGTYSYKTTTGKKFGKSNNPNAGKQFIAALAPLYKSERVIGQRGRRSKKFDGRLIFKAWGQDQGRANSAVLTAIDQSIRAFHARTGNKHKTVRRVA